MWRAVCNAIANTATSAFLSGLSWVDSYALTGCLYSDVKDESTNLTKWGGSGQWPMKKSHQGEYEICQRFK